LHPVLEVVAAPPFEANTYVFGDADAGTAVVVDPGGDNGAVQRILSRNGLVVAAIIATHAHIDHVAGAADLREQTGAPFLLHDDARPMLAMLPQQALWFGVPPIRMPIVDAAVRGGQVIAVGAIRLAVRETPGHSPGHVTLLTPRIAVQGVEAARALCGDVLFYGSIGRVDLPGGDYGTLMRSIEREILTQPDDTVLCSGHGPETTVGTERRRNPFILDWLARGARARAAGRPNDS